MDDQHGHASSAHSSHHGHHHPLWLALGVIVTKWVPPFRRRSVRPLGIEWRYVSTRREHEADARYVVVACPDLFYENATAALPKIRMGFQFSCFCKTAEWFKHALRLFPTARFIGKMEDDSVIHDARVVAELIEAHRLARRERDRADAPRRAATDSVDAAAAATAAAAAAPSPQQHAPWLWYGHFGWVLSFADGHAKWCGDIDDHLLSTSPAGCARQAERGGEQGRPLLAPYASGGVDIRSRALAQQSVACDAPWEYIRGFDPANQTYAGSCDGQHGVCVCRGLEPRTSASYAAQLPGCH